MQKNQMDNNEQQSCTKAAHLRVRQALVQTRTPSLLTDRNQSQSCLASCCVNWVHGLCTAYALAQSWSYLNCQMVSWLPNYTWPIILLDLCHNMKHIILFGVGQTWTDLKRCLLLYLPKHKTITAVATSSVRWCSSRRRIWSPQSSFILYENTKPQRRVGCNVHDNKHFPFHCDSEK